MTYQNPILRGSHPDPSICKVGDTYYLANSSFEYLPGLPVYESKDLINWKLISFGIDQSNVDAYPYDKIKNSMGMLAPTIRYNGGIFYMICTFAIAGTFIIESSDIRKGWSKPHWIKGVKGIDPSITFVNNHCYLQMTTSTEIYQCKINPHTGEVLSDSRIISKGSGGRDPEGPHVYYQFGKYWFLIAEGGTREGHMVTVHVADSIWGPYKPVDNNPILSNRDYKGELQCVGHADIIETEKDKFELVALAVREPKHVHLNLLGRETILLPVDWNEKAITVNSENRIGNATLELSSPISNGKQKLLNNLDKNDIVSVFSLPKFKLDRNSLTYLAGDPKKEKHNFIGFRQSEFDGEFSFSILNDGGEKRGLTVYKDETHYFRALYNPTENTVEFTKQNSDLIVSNSLKFSNTVKNIRFSLIFDKNNYQIIVSDDDEMAKNSMNSRHLTCEESNSPFTGIIIGLTRTGGEECKFDDLKLEYEPKKVF